MSEEDPRKPSFPAVSGPIVRSLQTNDFDVMARAFASWNHRFDQLSGGRFLGRIDFVQFDGVQILDCEVNQTIRCRGERPPDSFTFSPINRFNDDARWRGRVLRAGMINVLGPDHDMDHRTAAVYRNTSLVVSRDLMERTAVGLIGRSFDDCLCPRTVELEQHRTDALLFRWRQILHVAVNQQGISHIAALDAVSDFVRTIAAGRAADPIRTTPAQRLRAVRHAEEYARFQLPESVSILTLCELTGLSERSLHYAFMEVTGISPKAYLKAMRLNHARREILVARREGRRIQDVALRFGFDRPGTFAADYRRLFGELPSRSRIHATDERERSA